MRKRRKLVKVLSHMFSRKTIGYITLSFLWTMLVVLFWNWIYFKRIVLFESMEITLTIMGGKLIIYAVWDWLHFQVPYTENNQRVVEVVTSDKSDEKFGEHCVL